MAYSTIFNGSKSVNVAQGSSTTQFNNLVEGVLTRITLTSDLTARLIGTCEDDMSKVILKNGTYMVQHTPITKSFELKVNCCVFSGSIKLTVINNAIKCELITEFKQSKPVDGIGWEITGGITIAKIENDPDANIELIWSGHGDAISIPDGNGTFNIARLKPNVNTTYVFPEGLSCSTGNGLAVIIPAGENLANGSTLTKKVTWQQEYVGMPSTMSVTQTVSVPSHGILSASRSVDSNNGCWTGPSSYSGNLILTEIYQSLNYSLASLGTNAVITLLKNGIPFTGNEVQKNDKLTISASANIGYQMTIFKVKHGATETNWASGQTITVDDNLTITAVAEDLWDTVWMGSQPLLNSGTFNIFGLKPSVKTKYIFSEGLSCSTGNGSQIIIPAGENLANGSTLTKKVTWQQEYVGMPSTMSVTQTVNVPSHGILSASRSVDSNNGCWTGPSSYSGNLVLTEIYQSLNYSLASLGTNVAITLLKNGIPFTGSEIQKNDILTISASANAGYQMTTFKVKHGQTETNWTSGQTIIVADNLTITAVAEDLWDTVWTGSQSLLNNGTFNISGLKPSVKTKYIFSEGLSCSAGNGSQIIIPAGENLANGSTLTKKVTWQQEYVGMPSTMSVTQTVNVPSHGILSASRSVDSNNGCWTGPSSYIGNLILTGIHQSTNYSFATQATNATISVLKNGISFTGDDIKKNDVLTISASTNTNAGYQMTVFKVKHGATETNWTSGQTLTVDDNITITAVAWVPVWIGSQSLKNGGTFNIPGLQTNKTTVYTFSDGLSVQMNGYSSGTLGTKTLVTAGEHLATNSTLTASAGFSDGENGSCQVKVTITASSANTLTVIMTCTGGGGCWAPYPNYSGNLTLTKIEQ